MRNRYSNEELIDILKVYYKNNKDMKISDFKAINGLPNFGVYIKRFGSWNNAKKKQSCLL